MKKFFAALALLLILSATAFACCGDVPAVDADDALKRSQRKGRDPIEGFWGVHIDWHPEKNASRMYRVAIVKNTYDIFTDADYLAVSTCKSAGCVSGEVKMFFYRTNKKNEFDAVIVTSVGYGRGKAFLVTDDEGREDSALDMRKVTFNERPMTKWLLRIKGK